MQDEEIINLIWERCENGLSHLSDKYEKYCHTISYRILKDYQDASECVNDTWLRVWNAIPPKRPAILSAFLAKIVRNLSLNYYTKKHALKRGSGEFELAYEELEECIQSRNTMEEQFKYNWLVESIKEFLMQQSAQNRIVFIRRYFYLDDIKSISVKLGIREGTVKSILSRTRKSLGEWLKEESA